MDIVIVGASIGGLAGVGRFLASVDRDSAATFYIVVHSESMSNVPYVAMLLSGATGFNVVPAFDGAPAAPATAYLFAPGDDAWFEGGILRVARSADGARSAPAVDRLFMSAAASFGSRAIAVMLGEGAQEGLRMQMQSAECRMQNEPDACVTCD